MARILVLSLVFRPDNVSTAQIMGDLALDLKAMGHDVFVISTTPHYNEDPEALACVELKDRLGKLVQKSDYNGIEVFHVRMPRKGGNIAIRLAAWATFHVISTMIGMLPRFAADIILTPSPPLTIGLSAWLLSLRHRCPFVYNVQEIYPDVAVNLGILRNRALINILQKLERFVYARAAGLAVISEGMAERIRSKGVAQDKIHLIPNFVDENDFRLLPKDNPFSRRYGLQDKFVVSYAGNMGKPQGLDVLVEAAHMLREEKAVRFLMMGDGSERESLMKKARSLNLQNVIFVPYQPYSVMSEAYAASDASFVPQAPGTSNDGIPSKVYRIMACGRPVIARTDAGSDLAKLVDETGGGVVVTSNDAGDLAHAIGRAFRMGEAWLDKGSSARRFVLEDYSRSAVSERYHKLILKLTDKAFEDRP